MGKHIKTSMDEKVIDYLAIELYKADPDNPVLNTFMNMKNEEGYHLVKTIDEFKKTGKHPEKYNTDGTWKYSDDKIPFNQFLNSFKS